MKGLEALYYNIMDKPRYLYLFHNNGTFVREQAFKFNEEIKTEWGTFKRPSAYNVIDRGNKQIVIQDIKNALSVQVNDMRDLMEEQVSEVQPDKDADEDTKEAYTALNLRNIKAISPRLFQYLLHEQSLRDLTKRDSGFLENMDKKWAGLLITGILLLVALNYTGILRF
jgi:hypothetical protein